jgi:magnesium-transporting ATPase (P-type)
MWIGGAIAMATVVMPALASIKELGPLRGRVNLAISKKFIVVAWVSIIIFFVTGTYMTIQMYEAGSTWSTVIIAKHLVIAVMVIGGVVMTLTVRGMEKMMLSMPGPPAGGEGPPPQSQGAPPGPPPELLKLVNRQKLVGAVVLVMGILVLLLTAIAEAL